MAAHILIVEDNLHILELMRHLLAARGYEVLTAVDGVSATKLLSHKKVELLLCDMQMPRMSGFDLAKWVRAQKHLREIPMVAVTALTMEGDKEKILEAGFDGYLSKPITLQTFMQDIRAYLPGNPQAQPAGQSSEHP